VSGCRSEPVFGPLRPGDVRHASADTRLARKLLGFEARIGMDEGIRRLVEMPASEHT